MDHGAFLQFLNKRLYRDINLLAPDLVNFWKESEECRSGCPVDGDVRRYRL